MPGLALILANGEYPQNQQLRRALLEAQTVICCDGAAETLLSESGREPDWIVGDLDSLPMEQRQRWSGKLIHIQEQETNDLDKACRFCLSSGIIPRGILGATGKREDHTLGNISRLPEITAFFTECRLFTDYGYFQVIRSAGRIQTVPGTQISIFAAHAGQLLTSTGLKYPLNRRTLPRLYSGTLNEAANEVVTLTVSDNQPVMIFVNTADFSMFL